MRFYYFMTVVLPQGDRVMYTFDNGDDFLRVLRRELRMAHLITDVRRSVVC